MGLHPAFAFVLPARPPFDFALTVHKPAGWSLFTPFEVWEDGILWTSAYFGERLYGFRLSGGGSPEAPRVRARVYAEGDVAPVERTRVRALLASKLALDDDLRPFYRMADRDPILKHPAKHLRGMRSTSPAHLFADVVLALSLHMAPMKRSENMMECFLRRHGGRAEFERRSIAAWPPATLTAGVRESDLRRRCRMGFRAKYVVACAKRIRRGFPEYEDLMEMTAEDARRALLELPGVGEYSADILNPHGGFPIDVWTADVFGMLFSGSAPENGRDAIASIKAEGLRRWGDMAWMAFFYVVQDLPNLSEKLGLTLRLS